MKSSKKPRDNCKTKRKNQIFPLSKNAKERAGSFNNVCKSTGTVFHEWSLNISGTYKIKKSLGNIEKWWDIWKEFKETIRLLKIQ